jgi:hypothetical protein
MKNKQLILTILVALVVVVVMLYQQFGINFNLPIPYFNNSDKPELLMEESLKTFDSYLSYAKDHNIEGLATLSHKLGPVCSDPEKLEECNALMDTVYQLGSEIEKEKLTITLSDKRQIILLSEYERVEDEFMTGYKRTIIYFTRDEKGNPKLLSFNNSDGAFVLKTGLSSEITEDRLQKMIVDTDQDSLPDEAEVCTSPGQPAGCSDTDPNNKDSNGNGWWDSIERFFR